MAPLRLIFAGSGAFGAVVLAGLRDSPHTLCAVLSQPDRPAGRGLRLRPTPVAEVAQAADLPLLRPDALDASVRDELVAHHADAMIVADFGQLIPESWLWMCPGGSLNVHPSLLPRWRGAAPIARAIEAGDQVGGCTIMLMDAGLDTGKILAQADFFFAPDDTTASAQARLAPLGAALLLRYLSDFNPDHPTRWSQEVTRVCHAPALRKEEAPVDWSEPAYRVAAKIRAFNPHPVATARQGDATLRLWQAHEHRTRSAQAAGQVLRCNRTGLWVSCGEGQVQITEVQRAGARRMSARDFCNASPLVGERLT